MPGIEAEVGRLLRERGLTLGTVESATGGLISNLITNIPGSSDYYRCSVVTYSDAAKASLVGVREATLERYGAVSAPVARQMATGGRRVLGVDICLSDTGIAGPGGATSTKPVGLFYVALAADQQVIVRRRIFKGEREENKRLAAEAALRMLLEYLRRL